MIQSSNVSRLTENAYDAIILGSGIGSLAVASLLTQVARKRVLVLESHFKIGGLTHTFRRKDYEWDVGLHYVGNMAPGTMSRRFMDLVTQDKVDWRKIEDPYDQFVFPGMEFAVPCGEQAYQEALIKQFPASGRAIRRYFKELKRAAGWAQRAFAAKSMPPNMAGLILKWNRKLACSTTDAILRRHFDDPKLRGILAAQWGNYGVPPSQSAFGTHALIAADYFNGGYYPRGGSGEIADAIVPIIEQGGGRCLVNHCVKRLDIVNRRVKLVWAEHKGEEVAFQAPIIISGVGARKTYKELMGAESSIPERAMLRSDCQPATATTLYLGLREDPRKHGFREGNYWIYDGFDHDRIYGSRELVIRSHVRQCFLSFPSLRSGQDEHHTAELISFCDYASWQRWQSQTWLKRDEEYRQIKRDLSDAMIRFVERFRPGFRALVDYSELSTPLSVVSMTGHERGAIYGHPATPKRLREGAFPVRTSVKNLFLTGCDVGSVGINGAMMGGVMTTAVLLGSLGFPKLLAAAKCSRPAQQKAMA